MVILADETVEINGYGPARQLTLFEHDEPVLQILTSDLTAPAAALLAWLRCRWRIENVFKYLTAHHGIDCLCRLPRRHRPGHHPDHQPRPRRRPQDPHRRPGRARHRRTRPGPTAGPTSTPPRSTTPSPPPRPAIDRRP